MMFTLFIRTKILLMCVILTVVSGQVPAGAGQSAANVQETTCHYLREEVTQFFRRIYGQSASSLFLNETLLNWIERFLPDSCKKHWLDIHRSSIHPKGRQRPDIILPVNAATYTKLGHKVAKLDYSEADMFLPKEKQPVSPPVTHDVSRNRRETYGRSFAGYYNDAKMSRVKRLLAGSSPGAMSGLSVWSRNKFTFDPKRQFRDLIQLINFFGKPASFPRNNPLLSYIWYTFPRTGVTPGMSGVNQKTIDYFSHGRKRREIFKAKLKPGIRKKRFLFGEAAETPPMPSLFSIMMGTAQDPVTGKRLEFGGDAMRNMMVNQFTSFLPPEAQPPNELVKIMAPVWYFNVQQGLSSPSSYHARSNGQNRNRQGYYGDVVYGKKRRKR